ncbi:hypothetical protein WJT86_08430 [Microvirga sp. W0021]|uniref:Glutamine amidotransferase domain-containing protein n=1 Tax=Hohaiivirga grylli TaxID=3133970 RepID=A0ABV0BLC5_9HYPH
MISLSIAPFISMPVFWGLLVISALLSVLWIATRGLSGLWRSLSLGLLCLTLLNPSVTKENAEPVKSIIAVVTDKTASQKLGHRQAITDAVKADITKKLEKQDVEVRFIDVTDAPDDGGTRLFSSLSSGLADIPRSRIAGTIMITDGVIHDIPQSAQQNDIPGPLHALIISQPNEMDRQIRLLTTPRYGIIGKELEIKAIVEEKGGTGIAPVAITQNGQLFGKVDVKTGTPFSFKIKPEHSGSNVFELEVPPLPNELSLQNNRAILNLEGIRDKLRILLVSGQPNPAERTWRNLLKSDPDVELVHFTILRPATKGNNTPIDELSLIEFPIHDLFVNQIDSFNLVIFDRYANQGYIPAFYFDNISRYVSAGGALLIEAGPEYVDYTSIARTSLANLLPNRPTGQIVEQPFRPSLSEVGKKHPVTGTLPGSDTSPPQWGNWFRIIGSEAAPDKTLMVGPSNIPLLVLDKSGQGRIAMLMSDQVWLWARGYDGGGPYHDLQRRIVHWLVKEPSLEEEALRATLSGNQILVERQTMKAEPEATSIQMPDGSTQPVELKPAARAGIFSGSIQSAQSGLHTIRSEELTRFISIGPDNPREFIDVFSNTELIRKFAESTKGSVRRVTGSGDDVSGIPAIYANHSGSTFSGTNWIGFSSTNSRIIKGIGSYPATTGILAILVLAGMLVLTWLVEGRRKR